MAGAGSVTSIAIEGDYDAGQAYVPRAKKLLRRLVERVNLGGVQNASDFLRLDDSAYCYAVVAGVIGKAVIVVEGSREVQYEEPSTRFVPQVPDFYSGVVFGGTIPDPPVTKPPTPKTLHSFWPTPACARLFDMPDATHPVEKLTVEPYKEFSSELGPPQGYQGPTYSQYVKLKPTMYSGTMRSVVQLLMGFGRQRRKSIYDAAKPPVGLVRDRKRAREHPTKYQRDVQSNGLQIRYDWRWHRTHGITRGDDGRLWLVEIGNTRGIIAMPLPMNPTSQLEDFQKKLEGMGDDAGLYVLDRLGGFPTGESFPANAIESWIRAGRVLRLADRDELDPFYSNGFFSSVLGWAFSDSGTEAHNTCVSYDPDYFQTAYHYTVSLSIGEMTDRDPAPAAAGLKARFQDLQGDDRYQAVMWKIDHMPEADVERWLQRVGPPAMLFDQLDELENAPLASGSASLLQQERGRLFKLGKLAQYDLKFPAPELGYLLSWDMQPAMPGAQFHGRCDTTVHVFFVGEQLKYVRFFNDPTSIPWETVEDDADECQLIGTFTRTEEHGSLGLPIMVYSNDFDDRKQLPGSRSVRVSKGIDLGYAIVEVGDDLTNPTRGWLTRSKRFRFCTDTESWTGEWMASAMVVPFYDRCAYYYALATSQTTHSHTYSCRYKTQGDPWLCNTWRNFPGWSGHWAGDITDGHWVSLAQHPDGCGPVTARTVRSPGAVYSPSNCSDFADTGPWCFVCDNADGMVYSIPDPPLPKSVSESDQNVVEVSSWIVSGSGLTPLFIEKLKKNGLNYMNPWFIMSPDPETELTQYAEESHNAFGDSELMRYYDKPNGKLLVKGSPMPPGIERGNATFIGVV